VSAAGRSEITCAEQFAELFPAVYLRFHRRDAKRAGLSSASRSVLQHLSQTGPLTVGEMARHFDRAQSVVSEMIDHLTRDGFLERIRDARDRRRSLVWMTEDGIAYLESEREVLSSELVARAMRRMSPSDRRALIRGMRALVEADGQNRDPPKPRRKS
jgi:DNA-binding MarR family transcriptional regulator